MKYYKRGKMRNLFVKAYHRNLIVDLENKLFSNGYAIYVIDDYIEKLLKEFNCYENCEIKHKQKFNLNFNLKQYYEKNTKINLENLDFTNHIMLDFDNNIESYVYVNSKNENIYVNREFIDVIDYKFYKIQGFDHMQSVRINFKNECIAIILPRIKRNNKFNVTREE